MQALRKPMKSLPSVRPPEPPAGVAALRLRRNSPEDPSVQGDRLGRPHEPRLHSLTERLSVVPFDVRLHDIRFCYAPRAADSAMLFWYRFEPNGDSNATHTPVHVALHLRWFDDAGRALMWDTGAIEVEWHDQPHWSPLVAPMPLWPQHVRSLRFEILAQRTTDRVPLATGLVFKAANQDAAAPESQLMAFALPTREHPAERVAWLTKTIDEDLCSIRPLDWRRASHALPPSIDLRQPNLEDVDKLYFVDWKDLGRRITMLDRACTRSDLVSMVALPNVPGEQACVVGILKSGSRCRFELA